MIPGLIEILSGGASFLLSAWTSMSEAKHKRDQEQARFQMSLVAASNKHSLDWLKAQQELVKTDPHFSITRRMIAMGIVFGVLGGLLLMPALFPNIPWILEVSDTTRGLFGITTSSHTGYETITGWLYQPWMGSAFMSVVGFYFGNRVGR